MTVLAFVILFFVLFFLGMPIAFAMITSAWAYALLEGIDLGFLSLQMFTSLDFFVLLAIPLFILTSEVMNRSSVSARIFDFANSLVGFIPGGLGHVNVLTSVIFSGMSGSAVADVGGIGRLCYRSMVEDGYSKPYSAAVTASSSVVGPIIPPSIPMVVFSMVSGESIARLFLGGAVPGILIAVCLMIYIYFLARHTGHPVHPRQSLALVIAALIRGFFPLLTPGILLGGIYLGVVTITEAAALAVVYSLILGIFAFRQFAVWEIVACLKSVFIICGSILILLPAAKVFGFVLTAESVPDLFSGMVLSISDNPVFILIAINVLFLVLGCISDPNVNIMLFVPIVMPLANAIGMDPTHFGVVVVLNCMIGLVTPPVGSLLFTLSGMENIPIEKIIKQMWPFIAIFLLLLVVVTAFPSLVLTLPNMLS